MNRIQRILSAGLAGLFLCTILTACGAPGIGFRENQVFKVGSQYATKEQAAILMCGIQKEYGNLFGQEAWQQKFGDGTLEQYVKQQVHTQLFQLTVMKFWADKKDITLDKKEEQQASRAADIYWEKFSKEEAKRAGFSKKDVEGLYVEYALACKLYKKITGKVKKEISDDQARMIDIQMICFKTTITENGVERKLNQEEHNAVADQAYLVWQEAAGGTQSFETLAAKYNEGVQLDYHVGRGELEKELEEEAFNLGNEQISGLVEASDGIYIIKCISNYNQAETDANKTAIYKSECEKVFCEEYDKFMKDVKITGNEESWAEVAIVQGEIPDVDFVRIFEEAGQ